MRQFCNLIVAHRRRHTLQRMRIAENLIDDRYVFGILFQTQKALIQGLQMFVRFIQKHIHILIRIHAYSPYILSISLPL